MTPTPKITPILWFNDQAEEAVSFYVSVFQQSSRIVSVTRYGESGPTPKGSAMSIVFELDGQRFVAHNGGPDYQFNDAIAFSVDCRTQEEADVYWDKLSKDGVQGPCVWLRDRFGLSWQIVPSVLRQLLDDPDPRRSQNVMRAMMQMRKRDVEKVK